MTICKVEACKIQEYHSPYLQKQMKLLQREDTLTIQSYKWRSFYLLSSFQALKSITGFQFLQAATCAGMVFVISLFLIRTDWFTNCALVIMLLCPSWVLHLAQVEIWVFFLTQQIHKKAAVCSFLFS